MKFYVLIVASSMHQFFLPSEVGSLTTFSRKLYPVCELCCMKITT